MADRALEPELPVRLGEVVAEKYRVERLIGSGGMGCVVEATHLQLLQRVAIKFVRADTLEESSAVRLLREARAAVSLHSQHVARVVDVGTLPSGIAYLVMEYLDGETLGQRLAEEGQLPIAQAMWVASQACKGLAEAHRRGIVHRDVKPANLFLARQGDGTLMTKLLDFGIAKVADPRIAVAEELTSSEHALGTPRYMSPEQLTASSRVDARTDVWSLGVVLFECLTGRAPFSRGTSYEVGAQILGTTAPRVSDVLAGVPDALDDLVARCLTRDTTVRFADANELLAALEQTGITPEPIIARAVASARAEARPPGGGGTALGLGAPPPSLPPTRVAPLAPPVAAAPVHTEVLSPVAASSPALATREGTMPLPLRSRLNLIAMVAVPAILLALVVLLRLLGKGDRSDPVTLTPVPVAPEADAATTTLPLPTASVIAPGERTTADETATATADKPEPRPTSSARRPTSRPMTRPPNER